MNELTSSQCKYLRGLAHKKKPVVQVGQKGMTDALVKALDDALETHELIKIKFVDYKEKSLHWTPAKKHSHRKRLDAVIVYRFEKGGLPCFFVHYRSGLPE